MKLKDFKNCVWSNPSPHAADSYTKIFYITAFPEHSTPYVGMNYRTVSIVPIEKTKLAYFALCAEGFVATKSVNQLVCVVLEAVEEHSRFPQRFSSIPDMRMILRKAMRKVTDNNASPHEGIVGAILEVSKTDR